MAPSYQQFLGLADGVPVDWSERPPSGRADIAGLLDGASTLLGGRPVSLVTIDMPVSLDPIVERRVGDDDVSREYGKAGCGTHSPSRERPGRLGHELTSAFAQRGFPVATTVSAADARVLAEVYPHPALLTLMDKPDRQPYKISRTTRYWGREALSALERKTRVVNLWRDIIAKLSDEINDIDLPLPPPSEIAAYSFNSLKRFEDALDALTCGWVGIRYVEGRCHPYGNDRAAIWIPE